jgi:Helix-turn-helix domain
MASAAKSLDKPSPAQGEFLTPAEVCAEFGVSKRTLRRWTLAGIFAPSVTFGSRRFFRRAAIIDFFRAHETASGQRAPRRRRSR